MLNAGTDLTIDCWLKIMSLLESFFLVFDCSTRVFDLLWSLKVEWLGILNPSTCCTLEGLIRTQTNLFSLRVLQGLNYV